jgi:hypothetical protein
MTPLSGMYSSRSILTERRFFVKKKMKRNQNVLSNFLVTGFGSREKGLPKKPPDRVKRCWWAG